jgi:FtsZ-binding cell division protein ZapB
MSETTAEPLAGPADATPAPAPTLDETMDRIGAELYAEDDGQTAEPAANPAEGQQRGPDGKFIAAEAVGNPADPISNPAEPTANPAEGNSNPAEPPPAPSVPDYIAPYAADFAMRGLAPEQAIPILVDTWRAIERNHEAGLNDLAGRYGFKVVPVNAPAPVAQPAATPAQQDWVDPNIAALQQEIEALKAKDAQREQMTQEQQEAAYRAAYGRTSQEIQDFAKKAAAEGINFDLLRGKMSALIIQGEAQDLADAYDQAVYANPTTREIRKAAERKQSEAAAAAEAAAKAQAARRAGVINVRADTAAPRRGGTLEETMNRVADEIYARS